MHRNPNTKMPTEANVRDQPSSSVRDQLLTPPRRRCRRQTADGRTDGHQGAVKESVFNDNIFYNGIFKKHNFGSQLNQSKPAERRRPGK